MPATVIVGAQWGDEGKGKIVDRLSESADLVVRYAGGPNAGHTLVVAGEKTVLRLVPSGALHSHTTCLLGQGMVIHPGTLLEELDTLAKRGVNVAPRMVVSRQAHLILPYHVLVDELREGADTGTKIGTTKRGIGPAYEDKVGRRGIRTGDLERPDELRAKVEESLAAWAPTIAALGGSVPDAAAMGDAVLRYADRLTPLLGDAARMLEDALLDGKRAMLEGAQGTMLDIDNGTYPFVTSSSAVAGGACTGAGIGPTHIARVLGITKAYTTRVGAGPFPTELHGAEGDHLRTIGHEFGSVTGRPRRTGWLDIAALRYARRVNGLSGLALTKLDVLTGLPRIAACVGYESKQGTSDELSPDLVQARPLLRTFEGWAAPLTDVTRLEDLPRQARLYLDFIEEMSGVPIDIVSVGPGREQTIERRPGLAH